MSQRSNSTDERDRRYLLHPNANARLHEASGALEIARGDGIYVVDHSGKRYIEALSGLWCAGLGFSEKRLAEAAYQQMLALPYYHLFTNKVTGPAVDLAEKLISLAPVPMKKVFLTSSGSEANETVIKLLWFRANAMGQPQRKKFIGRVGGFHGVTLGAASLTGLPANHNGFDLPLPGFLHVSKPHHWRNALPGETELQFSARLAVELEELILKEGPDTIAAFWAEPVMGGGGVIVPPEGYWAAMGAVLKKYGILLVSDEVICGFGRTGEWFGAQSVGMDPDIMVVSKQMSSGYMPVAALMMRDEVYQPIADGSEALGLLGHGLTAGGHPVSAAVSLETIRIIEEEGLVARTKELGVYFRAQLETLRDLPIVGEIRSIGLLAAVELVADPATKAPWGEVGAMGRLLTPMLQERGVILRIMGDSIGLCPPMIITRDEIDLLMARLRDGLEALLAEMTRKAA